jgi:hypothetical protein
MWVVAIIVRVMAAFRSFPRAIWGGAAVGAIVGLIIAVVNKGDAILVTSWVLSCCGMGLVAGTVFELVMRLVVSITSRRRS